jgi:hypothetical protein
MVQGHLDKPPRIFSGGSAEENVLTSPFQASRAQVLAQRFVLGIKPPLPSSDTALQGKSRRMKDDDEPPRLAGTIPW